MALSEIYVDPSIAADSGTGTISDPFGDLEYAIEQTTFDTTNGTRVNIKAGTDEVLAAQLGTALSDTVTTPAWAPSDGAPIIFQGYTSVAGDGGIGGISAGGAATGFLTGATWDWVKFIDIHLNNSTGLGFDLDNDCAFINCKFSNITGGACASMDNGAIIQDCYFTNCYPGTAASIIYFLTGACVRCYFDDAGANTFGDASFVINNAGEVYIAHNIINLASNFTGNAIRILDSAMVVNNSIYADGAAATGILVDTGDGAGMIENNLIEGFSGAGGIGIAINASDKTVFSYGGNAVYDCTTAYDETGKIAKYWGDNETLTASPFNDAANGDFSPVDTGNVKEGSLPNTIGNG